MKSEPTEETELGKKFRSIQSQSKEIKHGKKEGKGKDEHKLIKGKQDQKNKDTRETAYDLSDIVPDITPDDEAILKSFMEDS